MTPSQAVIFDLGKVLLDFDYMIAARKLAARSNVSAEAINQLINQSSLLVRYERAKMNTAEFFEAFRSATGFQGDLEEFAPLFGDIFSPIQPMIELQSALRKQSVPTYIFSNTNELAVTHITRTYPFFSQFDGYIYSYKHGWMKPDAKIYEIVERETGRRGEQLIYVDDRAENIAGAAARDWQVVLHETPEKTIEAFKKAGLPAR
jgi:FMN phosphatase YigB (HAD superfamily)